MLPPCQTGCEGENYPMLQRKITVEHTHRILFTRDAFDPGNTVVSDLLAGDTVGRPAKVLVFVDDHVVQARAKLPAQIVCYAAAHLDVLHLAAEPLVIPAARRARMTSASWSSAGAPSTRPGSTATATSS